MLMEFVPHYHTPYIPANEREEEVDISQHIHPFQAAEKFIICPIQREKSLIRS